MHYYFRAEDQASSTRIADPLKGLKAKCYSPRLHAEFNAVSASPVASLPNAAIEKECCDSTVSQPGSGLATGCACVRTYAAVSNATSVQNSGLLRDIITKQITHRPWLFGRMSAHSSFLRLLQSSLNAKFTVNESCE